MDGVTVENLANASIINQPTPSTSPADIGRRATIFDGLSHRVIDAVSSATSAPNTTEISDEDLLPLPTDTAPAVLFMGQDAHGAPALLGAAVSTT